MAANHCTSVCFVAFVVFSLLSHLTELVLCALLAFTLNRDVIHRDVFFPLTSGLIILPSVLVQLVSAVSLLRRRGDSMTEGEAGLMAILHVLQLGFVWRHLSLLKDRRREAGSSTASNFGISRSSAGSRRAKHSDLSELLTLRLIFTFSGGFPQMLVQLYLVLHGAGYDVIWPWALYGALAASIVSTTWALASFQRRTASSSSSSSASLSSCSCDECSSCCSSAAGAEGMQLMSWPGSLFRILWRGGELVSRVISLTLFSSLYHQWVFLVLGLHWLVMLICLSLPQTFAERSHRSGVPSPANSSPVFRRAACCVVTSYSYVFAYVNARRARSAVWYTLYYVIMFLENGTLSIVWLTKSSADSFTAKYLHVFISTLAFLAAMVCLSVYYKYFHLHATPPSCSCQDPCQDVDGKPPGIAASGSCCGSGDSNTCRHSNASTCSHHPPSRCHHGGLEPFPNSVPAAAVAHPTARWMTHNHSALTAGQYYSQNAVHDSLLGSVSDLDFLTTAGPGGPRTGASSGRHRGLPKMGLSGSTSLSLDSVVGVGLRPGAEALTSHSCCCCYSSGDDGCGTVGCSRAGCRVAEPVASCPQARHLQGRPHCRHPHHPHHNLHQHHRQHHHHHPNNNSRRCQQKTCSRSDLTDTTSVMTLASGASHNLGYEGSDETQSNNVPAWLPTGDSLIARHLLSPDSGLGGAGHAPVGERQDEHLENYRQMLRQEAQRWAADTTPHSRTPDTLPHSRTPDTLPHSRTQDTPPHSRTPEGVDPEDDSDSCTGCCCEASLRDSEVSSIFRAAHKAHSRGCQLHKVPDGSAPLGGGDGVSGENGECPGDEEAVPGVSVKGGLPHTHQIHDRNNRSTHPHHLHHQPHQQHQQQQPQLPLHKGKKASSSPQVSELATYPCCAQPKEKAGKAGRPIHSQLDVFTISHQAGSSNLQAIHTTAPPGHKRDPNDRRFHHRREGKTPAKRSPGDLQSMDPKKSSKRVQGGTDPRPGSQAAKRNLGHSEDSPTRSINVSEPEDGRGQRTTSKHLVSGSEGYRSGSSTDPASGVCKTSKHSEKRGHGQSPRRRSVSLEPNRGAFPTHLSDVEVQTMSDSDGVGAADSGIPAPCALPPEIAGAKHVPPSRLQAKAIVDESDDEGDEGRPPSAGSSQSRRSSSDPVYENVSAMAQQEHTPAEQNSGVLTATSTSSPANSAGNDSRGHADAKGVACRVKNNGPAVDRNLKATKSGGPHKETADSAPPSVSGGTIQSDNRLAKSPTQEDERNKVNRFERQSRSTEKAFTSSRHRFSSPGGRNDSWFMCSESEDSALPPETFSSSVDDGLSDVGSDISFELII